MSVSDLRKGSRLRNGSTEFAVRLLITLLVAVLIPVILGTALKKQFPLADAVILGMLIGIVGILGQLLPVVIEIRSMRMREVQLAAARSDGAELFNSLHRSYDYLVLANNVLFIAYFKRELNRLDGELQQAANKFELPVDQDSDTTEMMLLPFNGGSEAVIRAVHYFADNSFLADVHARQFFTDIYEAVISRRVSKVLRLMIYNNADELEDATTKRLVAFHAQHPDYDYKVMHQEDFEKLAHDARIGPGKQDFGIYGAWYMYRSLEASVDGISGVFLTAPHVLERFTNFFDRCWRSSLSHTVDIASDQVGISELFARRIASPGAIRPVPVPDQVREDEHRDEGDAL